MAAFLCAADCWHGFSLLAGVIIGSCGYHIPLAFVAHLTEDAIFLLCLRHAQCPNSHSQGTRDKRSSNLQNIQNVSPPDAVIDDCCLRILFVKLGRLGVALLHDARSREVRTSSQCVCRYVGQNRKITKTHSVKV